MKKYDVIVIGAGLSGLTAASLLSKRGLSTLVLEAKNKPGGSCGIFKRDGVIYEQGVAMMNGFSENGMQPARFLFNVLEEPIRVIEHQELMMIHYESDEIIFYKDLDQFIDEMISLFPSEEKGIKKFYHDLGNLYSNIIEQMPWNLTIDTLSRGQLTGLFLKNPIGSLQFCRYMNKNMKWLLEKYFTNPKLICFYQKLIYSFCYANPDEVPAAYGAFMLIHLHLGGSYYPAGSTLQLTGKLEKVIEEHNGEVKYHTPVINLCLKDYTVIGVRTASNQVIEAEHVIYSGNVWSLYDNLLNLPDTAYEPTDTALILYALVKDDCIPDDALPIEKFMSDQQKPGESDLTVYLTTLDDKTLCPDGDHILTVIGPTFKKWPVEHGEWYGSKAYQIQKDREQERIISILRRRYHSIRDNIVHVELATPSTLEFYCEKYNGSLMGPKYMIGQQFFRRQHTKTRINKLYCCGEGNIMGSSTSAVILSGISAANLLLSANNMREYSYEDVHCNYVTLLKPPYNTRDTNPACRCNYCDNAACESACPHQMPISHINRKLSAYNFKGVWKLLKDIEECPCDNCENPACEHACITKDTAYPVPIRDIIMHATKLAPNSESDVIEIDNPTSQSDPGSTNT